MPPRAPRSRFTLPGAVLTALALALLLATPALAGPIVSGIAVSGDPGALDVDVIASGPLGYLLNESAEPFTLTLVFAGARLGFPDEHRTFTGGALTALQVRTLTRDGDTLVRLDLTFGREVPYTVTRDAARVRIRAETGGPKPAAIIGAPGTTPPAEPAAAAAAPAASAAPPRTAELKGVHPESLDRSARIVLDVDGTPAFKTFVLTRPDRVVVDLENVRLPAKESAVSVRGGLLRSVRMSQHTKTVVRVVCDLSRPAPFRVEPVAGGLVVHLGEGVR
jgi:hypothetical protein